MALTIERIEAPSADELYRKYVRPRVPVVITGLYDEQPIHAIRTVERARRDLGSWKIIIQNEYVSHELENLKQALENPDHVPTRERHQTTIAGYLDLIDSNPKTIKISTENLITIDHPLRALYDLPSYLDYPAMRGDGNSITYMFMANAGNVSAMHFDSDIASVLHYHVFGRKRHILAPPVAAKKLNPLDVFSTALVQNFSEAEKKSFVDFIGGYDVEVQPGETLFMPAQYWHHVEYVDTAMSIATRFGHNRYTRYLHGLHSDAHRQGIASKMIDERAVEETYLAEFNLIKETAERSYPDPRAKFGAIRSVFREVHSRMCPEDIEPDRYFTNLDMLHEMMVSAVYMAPPTDGSAAPDPSE